MWLPEGVRGLPLATAKMPMASPSSNVVVKSGAVAAFVCGSGAGAAMLIWKFMSPRVGGLSVRLSMRSLVLHEARIRRLADRRMAFRLMIFCIAICLVVNCLLLAVMYSYSYFTNHAHFLYL
ncbi:MAG: hypothetical protein LBH58_11060 [Tannerellaceae bacterium]|nr:hypothetical protein [Tannerellaceae bacterium]